MTDPEHEILALHLRNLHELLHTIDLRLRRIEAALGFLAETGRIQPLGRLSPGPETLRSARREGFLVRLVGVIDRRPGETAAERRLRRGRNGQGATNDREGPSGPDAV